VGRVFRKADAMAQCAIQVSIGDHRCSFGEPSTSSLRLAGTLARAACNMAGVAPQSMRRTEGSVRHEVALSQWNERRPSGRKVEQAGSEVPCDDVLAHAYALAKANGGVAGTNKMTFADIEASGSAAMLDELREELKTKRYRPGPVRMVYIPKSGGERPLGIPRIRDRVVQTAVKLIIEPLFEADFDESSYGFRPKRNAHPLVPRSSPPCLTRVVHKCSDGPASPFGTGALRGNATAVYPRTVR